MPWCLVGLPDVVGEMHPWTRYQREGNHLFQSTKLQASGTFALVKSRDHPSSLEMMQPAIFQEKQPNTKPQMERRDIPSRRAMLIVI